MNLHCRICGYPYANAVTGICDACNVEQVKRLHNLIGKRITVKPYEDMAITGTLSKHNKVDRSIWQVSGESFWVFDWREVHTVDDDTIALRMPQEKRQ